MDGDDENATGSTAASLKRSPADFLKTALGRPVVVKLNSGVQYRGILATLDGYMNLVLEQCEEYQQQELKAKYAEVFLRGNNVLYLSSSAAR